MTVSLTPDQAAAKLGQIEQARQTAVSKLASIRDSQEGMLASSWHGGSATNYGKTSAQQQDDFNQIISTLNDVVQLSTNHIHSISNMDNN
jgi:uncharacterized protein YukE